MYRKFGQTAQEMGIMYQRTTGISVKNEEKMHKESGRLT